MSDAAVQQKPIITIEGLDQEKADLKRWIASDDIKGAEIYLDAIVESSAGGDGGPCSLTPSEKPALIYLPTGVNYLVIKVDLDAVIREAAADLDHGDWRGLARWFREMSTLADEKANELED